MLYLFAVFLVHMITICLNPLTLKNFMSNPPYCLPYNLCNVSLENLKLDQQIIPLLIFFLILVTCLLYIILIMKGEILSWSPMGLNPLTPKISLVIFLLPPIQFLWCKFGGFSIGSSYKIIPQLIFFFIVITCYLGHSWELKG